MLNLQQKKILLGVCGGIAAYKTAELARLFIEAGAEVQVVMTKAATDFIGVQTFQCLTAKPVWTTVGDASFEQSMAHIELSRWADVFVIAPITANAMAKIAHGIADDLLTLLCLMMQGRVVICPAMNTHMWQHPATLANAETLLQHGVDIWGPDLGMQACGDSGPGRMREPSLIVDDLVMRLHHIRKVLHGESFVITAGPTREAIDPVRYISNRSSGLMGYHLAKALIFAGAKVDLISGPTALSPPIGASLHRVETADEMHQAVHKCLHPNAHFIGVAAVSDFKPVNIADVKIKKNQQNYIQLDLTAGIDILDDVFKRRLAKTVIGFAAETHDLIAHARVKLVKKADMIIANQVGNGLGFEQLENSLHVLSHGQEIKLETASKLSLACQLVLIIADFLKEKNK